MRTGANVRKKKKAGSDRAILSIASVYKGISLNLVPFFVFLIIFIKPVELDNTIFVSR